ncbi:MAG TPA: hypothetical protein DCQ06_02825 [Myxococcales bacterium]|nr:hypothetical protein [Myxococcales bacterium]
MSEREFARRLVAGQAKHVLVTARGGVGKSTFARSLESTLCGSLPTFRVDLAQDVAPRVFDEGQRVNLIVARIESKMALQPVHMQTFRRLLRASPYLVLLDSLDEVALTHRKAVVAQINDLGKRLGPQGQVVILGRPAVDGNNYGLTDLDAHLHLPPLSCGRVQSTLRWTAASTDAERRTKHFIRTYRLDRQAKKGERCYFPFMAAYRDLQVVQREAEKFNPAGGLNALTASLSEVHESIIAERLLKELRQMSWKGAQVLEIIDRIVRSGGRDDGSWNLEFTLARCDKAVEPLVSKAIERQYICEKILQSALFEPIAGVEEWRFEHREVADLFLARWVDREIQRTGGKCDVVSHHAKWIGGRNVAGYLIGQAHGRGCLLELSAALCQADGGFEKAKVDLLYTGLPLGAARSKAVAEAQNKAKSLKADSCVRKTLSAL